MRLAHNSPAVPSPFFSHRSRTYSTTIRGAEMLSQPHWKKGQMSIKSIVDWFEAWRRYRSAVTELSKLGESDLAELGLSRDDIHEVARRSAGL